jgi:uncharacterized protein YegP (UPF0339 family)
MADPRFELYEKAGWHWRLVDVNGRIVASSFRYASKATAKKAAQRAKDAAAVAMIVDARPAVDVTAVSGAAFGEQVDITIEGMGTIASPPTPAVTLVKAGGNQTKSAPKVKVGPGGLFLTSGVLQVATRGSVGPSGSATSTASVAEPDLLGATLTATSVSSTGTANETGATGSTTINGGMLVLDESHIVTLPSTPAPNTTYEGTNADTGDTFTVILNEQVAGPGRITVTAVHIVLHGPTATGDILLARSQSGVTTSS